MACGTKFSTERFIVEICLPYKLNIRKSWKGFVTIIGFYTLANLMEVAYLSIRDKIQILILSGDIFYGSFRLDSYAKNN